jgi:hypothetical protein
MNREETKDSEQRAEAADGVMTPTVRPIGAQITPTKTTTGAPVVRPPLTIRRIRGERPTVGVTPTPMGGEEVVEAAVVAAAVVVVIDAEKADTLPESVRTRVAVTAADVEVVAVEEAVGAEEGVVSTAKKRATSPASAPKRTALVVAAIEGAEGLYLI